MLASRNPCNCISSCLSSSRLKTISFLGWYSRSMISANFFPNDPVPPVIITLELDQSIGFMFGSLYFRAAVKNIGLSGKNIRGIGPVPYSRWIYAMSNRSGSRAFFRRMLGGFAVAAASLAAYRCVCAAWADVLARSGNVVHAVRLAPGNASYWVELANLKDLRDSSAEDALDRARRLNPNDWAVWIQSGLRAEAR